MKRPRLITRRRAKWAGALASLLIAAATITSNWYVLERSSQFVGPSRSFGFGIHPGVTYIRLTSFEHDEKNTPPARWSVDRVHERARSFVYPRYRWTPRYDNWQGSYSTRRRVDIPLWIPLLLTALPTAFLFYRDRRPKPGHCTKCRYNLAGLESTRCPECGTDIPQASESTPALGNGVD